MNWVISKAKTVESWFNKNFAWFFTNGMKVVENHRNTIKRF